MLAPPPVPVKPAPGAAVPPPGVAVPPPPPPQSFASSMEVSPTGFAAFLLIQGKFDADKLQAKAKQAAKDHPGQAKSRKVGDIDLWEIIPPGGLIAPDAPHIYLALLDKDTLMVTLVESHALEALDKAAGKKKTDLKDKQVRDALAKADSKAALQVVASGDLVTQVAFKSDNKGGFTTTTKSLRDDGIEGFRGAVTLGDADLHSEWTLTVKDADKAKDMAKSMNDGLGMGLKNVTTAAQQMKDLLPLVDALKTIKITASGDAISEEGSATPDAIAAGIKAIFLIGRSSSNPSAKPDVRPIPPPPPMKDK